MYLRKIARTGTLLTLALVSGCVCTSVDLTNESAEPIFVSESGMRDGVWIDYPGVLLQPGDSERYFYLSEVYVHVRSLDGETILLEAISDDYDDDISITDGMPLPGTVPVFAQYTGRRVGETGSNVFRCGKVSAPLFGTLVEVRNESDVPLILSIAGNDERRDYPEGNTRGVLIPAKDEGLVYGDFVDRGWLQAFDQSGSLVYTAPVPKAEQSSALIPNQLPNSPDPLPDDYSSGCAGFGSLGWLGLLGGALAFVALVLGAVVAITVTAKWYWERRTRLRGPP